MKAKVAIIGGTSLLESSLFSDLEATTVPTPHGNVIVHASSEKGIIFIQRHHADADAGPSKYHPPHLINHAANLHAISQFGVSAVLAICSVGSFQPETLPPGTLLLPDDYISLFCPMFAVHDDERGHIVPGVDLALRKLLVDALEPEQLPGFTAGSFSYWQTPGPRFETAAESRLLNKLGGHVVGMTAANEATAAREFHLSYAMVAMVDNLAHGLAEKTLTHAAFKESVARHQVTVEQAVRGRGGEVARAFFWEFGQRITVFFFFFSILFYFRLCRGVSFKLNLCKSV